MVLKIIQPVTKIESPLFNELGYGMSADNMRRYVSKKIFNIIKSTPELVGMLDTLVVDHFMGPYDFFNNKGQKLGSTNLKRAKEFMFKFKVRRQFYGSAIDYFVDGTCFPWHDTAKFHMSTVKQKELFNNFVGLGANTLVSAADEQIKLEIDYPRKVGYLAASTTEILHNETGVYGYKQEASGKIKKWNTEQVKHIKLMEFNGEVRGWSGLKSLCMETAALYMLKENMIAKLGNGGSPDTIIHAKGTSMAAKARFERMKTALESFSHLRKSHGNMVLDTEVGAIPMGEKLKDMEYRELAMFAISEFCLALGLPTSRVPFMMTGSGGTSNKGELSGNSEDAYQKKINNRRLSWEEGWNEIFQKAGFMVQFRKDNLQDDIRETSASTQRSTYVTGVVANLKQNDKQLTTEAMLELLSGTKRDISQDDIEDYEQPKSEAMEQQQASANAGNVQPRKAELKSKVSKDRMASKMRSAGNNGVNA